MFKEKTAAKKEVATDEEEVPTAPEEVVEEGEIEYSPLRVSEFDQLIDKGGIERGNSILVSGGCGTGKTTFTLQSCFYGAMTGENVAYITLEEDPIKMLRHMKDNYGWDFSQFDNFIMKKVDPFSLSRSVEAELASKRGKLLIKVKGILDVLPEGFIPDRVVIDSLSALSSAFEERSMEYRIYLRHLFQQLENYNSINLILGETEQEPNQYSRTGVEEFLVDGVFVLYNIRKGVVRQRALEILKLRCSNHVKKLVPYQITNNGIELFPEAEVFV